MANDPEMITIEVAYATPRQQWLLTQQVPVGTTVGDALANSEINAHLDSVVQVADGKVGIFGKAVKLAQVLRAGDRIEVYRPLVADPKEARRRKAAAAEKANS